jgi:3-phenylpropionate/trans-cinnamate dioxygenase ferredoxin reductase component
MPAGMVIVGAGECGARAAFALREAGYDGPVMLIGAEPHLPYERPPLSKEGMLAEGLGAKTIADEARLAAAGIEYRRGLAIAAIDRQTRRLVAADGRDLPYDRLLLATGATPRRLQRDGAEIPYVAYLRTLDDAARIRARLTPGARLLVIGGGFIGLELAASATRLGARATVVEVLPRILSRGVPAEIAEIIADRHRAEGVEVITGTPIERIETTQDAARLVLADGRIIEADLVVAGIGALPSTGLAAAAGLAIENGVAVDAMLATIDPAIFAAGDCCSFPLAIYGDRRVRLESWRNAQDQGSVAARNMLGAGEAHAAVPWFWSDQYELTLQIAGLADEGKATVRRDLGDGAFILFHLAGDGRLVAASGIGAGNVVARDIRIAEMLIGRRARPDPAVLAAPATRLKSLLAA